eukprot:CAMPEP_0113623170 /NCGR_PEP_ID=MMETSP0017_2-20120614/11912_1 /TAXON_ID=2856 /ORGANISM="Cylindrotheca closterium" /LENGTH=141 /DNA_ID=CAMNT_0000533097 /DNA_START=78 /DNA_END=503 /DNA_ORIENTATION=+ /assembly_acc=CAM_ASM_000147
MNNDFSTSLPPPQTKMDFTSIIAPPTITAMTEISAYEQRLHEQEQKHTSLSLYEMETIENPHNVQRQLVQSLFGRPAAGATPAGGAPQVTIFRRLTDSFKEMAYAPESGSEATAGGEPQVTIFRRVTNAVRENAYGPNPEE